MAIKDKFDKPLVTPQPITDINAYNCDGLTPVQAAILRGKVDEVEDILNQQGINAIKLSADGKATMFYINEYQRTNGGTNPYTGQSPATPESEAIDRNARRMKDVLKSATCKRELTSTLGM